MKNVLFITLFVIANIGSFCQTVVPGGSVYGTWSAAGSPYLVQGSIMIPQDSTLQIQAGSVVQFQGHYKLLVLGRLLVNGTQTDSVIFTASNTTTGWYGLRFDNTPSGNDSSIIEYCSIKYGKANGTGNDKYAGGLFVNNYSKIRFDHSSISNCSAEIGGGIALLYSPILVNNSKVNGCTAISGGGIFCYECPAKFIRCLVDANIATGWGGGYYIGNSQAIIEYGTISNNLGEGAAGVVVNGSSNVLILGNIIKNNSTTLTNGGGVVVNVAAIAQILNNVISYNSSVMGGGGIWVISDMFGNEINNNYICNNSAENGGGMLLITALGSPMISNNLICNNSATFAGGICSDESNPILVNNTIVNNEASSGKGGGLYCKNASTFNITNCILYGNTASISGNQVYLDDENSDPAFLYCDVEGGTAAFETNGNFYTGTYQNNIDANPQFVSPTAGSGVSFDALSADWSEQNTSPCINAGNPSGSYPALDIAGNQRVYDGRIDMGAFEYQGPVGISPLSEQSEVRIYPLPAVSFITVESVNSDKVLLLNIEGDELISKKPENGIVVFDLSLYSSGLYLVEIRSGAGVIVKKFIKE